MERSAILGIICLALALRLVVAFGVQHRLENVWQRQFVISGDAEGYWELAGRLASGEPYAVHEPPRQVMRMPGYPLFLSMVIRTCGENLFAARIATVLVGTLTVALVYVLGSTLFSTRVGLAGAFLSAVSPQQIGSSVLLLSEMLFAFFLILNLCCFAVWRKKRETISKLQSHLWAGLTGVTIALATYVRPTWLPVVFVMGIYLFWQEKGAGRITLPLMIAGSCLLCLLPWAIRNQRLTGHWVWTTLWMGPSLYDGLNPDADGTSQMAFFDRESVMSAQGMSEFEMNRHYRDRALEFVKEQPDRAISLMARHTLRYWSPWPNAEQVRANLLIPIAVAAFAIPFFLLSIYGALRADEALWKLVVCLGPVLAFGIIHSVFVGSVRYRLPAEFPLAVLAGVGLVSLIERFSKRGGPAS
ncbi:MAG TPA: glycosyltransferase family 39 protein [Planctomycetaceae bacterium]|nr:glycosyltransferase family 39 protein [Planctomycetaceae bacterium]